MKISKKKTITLCASVSHYKPMLRVSEELEKLGFKVFIPETALVMRKTGDFNVKAYKTWVLNKKDYYKKTEFIKKHISKIFQSDAILIANYEKNGIKGDIGGNVLIEIAHPHAQCPRWRLGVPISEKLPIAEEVYGLGAIFLDSKIKNISLYY